MPTQVLPLLYVEPPTVEPYRYGLFSAMQQIFPEDEHWIIGGVEWESLASYPGMDYPAGIFNGGGAGGHKTLPDYMGTTEAWPFALYAGVDCGSIGRPAAEYGQRALDILALSSQHGAEDALWSGGAGNTPALNAPDTVNLTPSGTTSLVAGIGILEQYLREHYNGRGVLHARPVVASSAAAARQTVLDAVAPSEETPGRDRLQTTLGTVWSFGGGYDGTGPNAVAPAAGKEWIYATGQVVTVKGDAVTPATFEEALNRTLNRTFVIAEQPWLIGIDGPRVACQVTL